jgi:hypothetical protein
MLSMDEAITHELRRLRVRAYGPDGDIDSDGLERLRELESATRESGAAAPLVSSDPAHGESAAPPPAGAVESEVAVAAVAEPEEPRDETDATEPSAPAPRRRWMSVAWSASVVAAAAVAALVTYAAVAVSPVVVESRARQIATLTPIPDWTVPAFFGGNQEAQGYSFHGLLLITTAEGYFSRGENCLAAVAAEAVTDEATSIAGPLYSDCAAGSFPAAVKLIVDEEAPHEMRNAFAEGTALQFVLDGERIGVFVSE